LAAGFCGAEMGIGLTAGTMEAICLNVGKVEVIVLNAGTVEVTLISSVIVSVNESAVQNVLCEEQKEVVVEEVEEDYHSGNETQSEIFHFHQLSLDSLIYISSVVGQGAYRLRLEEAQL